MSAAQASPKVLCYGEALVDRLGPLGGDPATDLPVDDRLGGAPANVACGLSRLGTPAAFLGRLGEDEIGRQFKKVFQQRHVNTQALQWDPSRPSRIVLVKRDVCGDREFGGFTGDAANSGFADQGVDPLALLPALPSFLPAAEWLLVGTLPLGSALSAEALRAAVRWAGQAGVRLALDINWRPTFWEGHSQPSEGPSAMAQAAIRPLLQQADLIKFAKEEAEWLFDGETDPSSISEALPHKPAVLVTDGGGMLRWTMGGGGRERGRVGEMEAFRVNAVDTTGAGDAFVAGLLHGLVADPSVLEGGGGGGKVEEMVRFACGCGALVCQGAGAIDPQPTVEEVQAFLVEAGREQ
ncbi:ribokinase [Nannochloropsis oceanica]